MSMVLIEEAKLKLALEALERNVEAINSIEYADHFDDATAKRFHNSRADSLWSIKAIKEALAKSEQQPDYKALWEQMCERFVWLDKKLAVYSEAQPKQPEHDAAIKTLEGLGYTYHGGERWKPPLGKPAAWAAQPQPEPVHIKFPRDSTGGWDIDPSFLQRVRDSIDPDEPSEFVPTLEEIEVALQALEVVPSHLYTRPAPQLKPLIDWVSVDDCLPESGGYYLVTVATDDGPHVDVLMFDEKKKHWEHEGEPTFCHSYYFEPTHWAHRPEAAHGIEGEA